MADAQEQLRSQPPMPDFFKFDQIQKEEYLSQLGNFNQEQRAIFHKICDLWEPEIEYNRFIELGKNQFSFIQSHLSQLMQKLFNARCGLIKVRIQQGNLENEQIILCERDSIRFFYYYLENEYFYTLNSEDKQFLTPKGLDRRDIIIPGKYVETLGLTDISDSLMETQGDKVKIYLVKCENYDPIYMTPATLPLIIRLSRDKIRSVVKSPQLLTYLSKTLGLMESEILRDIKRPDNNFWNKLSRCLIENREEIADKRRHIPQDFAPSVSLVYAYTRNGLDEAERIRLDRQSQKDEMVAICQSIEMKPDKFLEQQELNDYLENGIKRWPDFKNTFYDQCVKMKSKTSLPLIVNLGNGYMHRDHIYMTFRLDLNEAAVELKQYYLSLMGEVLLSRKNERINVFATTESFVQSIRDRIKERFPILHTLLEKPKIVSEGIIHWAKKRSNTPSPDQVRILLNKYFEEDSTLKFIRTDRLLELYLQPLFMEAYQKLPLFRRVMMRLFGRYDSFLEAFSKTPDKNGVRKGFSPRDGSPAGSYTGKTLSPVRDPMEEYHRSRSSSSSSRSYRRSGAKEKEKRYSNREQNNAWSEFGEALKKDNRK
ncbi:MAG: hypothetical protein JXA95_01170 [Spirochaetales bacterium]|nr:hypothetical protein [Spirochaetales bacterium]